MKSFGDFLTWANVVLIIPLAIWAAFLVWETNWGLAICVAAWGFRSWLSELGDALGWE